MFLFLSRKFSRTIVNDKIKNFDMEPSKNEHGEITPGAMINLTIR